MTLNEYQKQALTTEIMNRNNTINATEPAFMAKILGLVGESGEVAEKFKKIIRDKQGKVNTEDKAEIKKELGDVLWYTAVIADYLGIDFEDVAQTNLNKLASRKARGVGKGSGDNR